MTSENGRLLRSDVRRKGERERVRASERELSVILSSIMAPIGLKAVVGESKILLSLLCFICDTFRRRPLCVAKSAFRFALSWVFSCNMRMFAVVHVGDGDDEEGGDEGRWSVVYPIVKASLTSEARSRMRSLDFKRSSRDKRQ